MKKTNDLTLGAMFGAIYGILLLFIRYLLPSTDSIIYYFIPLPIAIYTYWKGYKNGLILFVVLALLSFLICDPFRAILLLIPNFIVGLCYGILKKKSGSLTLITTFIFSLLVNFLSLYAFELLTGVSYFDSTVMEMSFIFEMFPTIGDSLINKIFYIVIPIVLILDSLIKTILINILFVFIINRLKIANINNKFEITYSWFYSLIYIITLIFTFIYIGIGLESINTIYSIIILSIFFILSILMLFIGIIGLKLYLLEKGKKPNILVIITTLIFPIGIILGLCFSIKYNKKHIIIG
jgi:hypothetical protein